jgi:CDP-diacylglycerol--glycerol-3-phosphate 3-phosphatidyltransferase
MTARPRAAAQAESSAWHGDGDKSATSMHAGEGAKESAPRTAGPDRGGRTGAATSVGPAGTDRARPGRVVPAGTPITATDVRPGRPRDPVADPVSPVSVYNAANALTVLRLLLVPVFVVFLFMDSGESTAWRIAAWAVYAMAAITDRFDGQLARKHNLVTDFGKVADPIADKALNGAALIGLSALDQLAWWVTVVILAREVGVTLLRFWVIKRGVIPASKGGKLKTLLQSVALGLYILPLTGWLATARGYVMAAALIVTVVTGLDYVHRAVRLRRRTATARSA